jgi:hypothetical protein
MLSADGENLACQSMIGTNTRVEVEGRVDDDHCARGCVMNRQGFSQDIWTRMVVELLEKKVFEEREELLSEQARYKQGSRWQGEYGRPDMSCVWQCRLLGVAGTSLAINETIQHPNKYSSLE